MTTVLILTEGPTEHAFVRTILQPHLGTYGIYPVSTMVTTRRNPRSRDNKGGYVPRDKLVAELRILLGHSQAYVTTLFDYYGFTGADGSRSVEEEEAKLLEEVGGDRRFIPYLQKHEFEAFMFSNPEVTSTYFNKPHLESRLERIVTEFGGVEEINNDPATCPSRRLIGLFDDYSKVQDGPAIARRIGIPSITVKCPRFGEWIERIGALGEMP